MLLNGVIAQVNRAVRMRKREVEANDRKQVTVHLKRTNLSEI